MSPFVLANTLLRGNMNTKGAWLSFVAIFGVLVIPPIVINCLFSDAWAAFWGAIVVVAAYFGFLRWVLNNLRDKPDTWALPLVYFVVTLLLAIVFAFYVDRYNLIEIRPCNDSSDCIISSLYFCVVTLTTLGYGDLVPKSPAARSVVSVMALLGATHAVAFVSLIIVRLQSNFDEQKK